MIDRKFHKNKLGFTIIELMLVILIVGFLMAYGVPAYRDLGLRQKISNEANSLLLDLTYARVTAVKEGRNVVVLSNNTGNWAGGWRIFLDDGDSVYTAADDVLLRESQSKDPSLTFIGGTGLVIFNNLGGATNLDSIIISNANISKAVTVRVAASGMVTTRD